VKCAAKENTNLFGAFKKKATPPAPSAVLQFAELKYPNTNIWINTRNAVQNDYAMVVAQHIGEIAVKLPHFLGDLTATGKKITIFYAAQNMCRGGINGQVKLRQEHSSVELGGWGNRPNFAAELQQTIQNSGHDVKWLAGQLCGATLHTWTGGVATNPFTTVNATENKVNAWLAGDTSINGSHPTAAEMDLLVMALQDWLTKGNGCDSGIYYNPTLTVGRPAQIGLFHEFVHAYYSAKGKQLGLEDSSSDLNGGRHFELMAMGLTPYHNKKYSENKLRSVWVCPPRTQY
jgi:hypothetical protein